ncbi:uncharacterized protein EDB93DRAFT_1101164 [Suillus bovinus]|uniref:uncharacterized protein n=1 Tax=Suillus bovinus TaxID=48563 RepID=UPI001B865534|nr:uncharacterized protein EDB93DRAFT_1101164 [Suillus bovinus]KAG2156718.1 hypothetical protein EDB93DRAFT_1101164 [Suillus bovinus]
MLSRRMVFGLGSLILAAGGSFLYHLKCDLRYGVPSKILFLPEVSIFRDTFVNEDSVPAYLEFLFLRMLTCFRTSYFSSTSGGILVGVNSKAEQMPHYILDSNSTTRPRGTAVDKLAKSLVGMSDEKTPSPECKGSEKDLATI